MITRSSAEWVLLSQVYHRVLAHSPSPESAKLDISDARQNGQVRLRAELREIRAQPGVRLTLGEKAPEPPHVVWSDYIIPPNTRFESIDWEQSRASRRDPDTKSMFMYVNIVVHRDDVLARWPAKSGQLGGDELFTLKPALWGNSIDLKVLVRRCRDWWRR